MKESLNILENQLKISKENYQKIIESQAESEIIGQLQSQNDTISTQLIKAIKKITLLESQVEELENKNDSLSSLGKISDENEKLTNEILIIKNENKNLLEENSIKVNKINEINSKLELLLIENDKMKKEIDIYQIEKEKMLKRYTELAESSDLNAQVQQLTLERDQLASQLASAYSRNDEYGSDEDY